MSTMPQTTSAGVCVATVYTLGMPKYVYVQVRGVEKPARIRADKIERQQGQKGQQTILILKRDDEQVGEFEVGSVQGWWIEDEER